MLKSNTDKKEKRIDKNYIIEELTNLITGDISEYLTIKKKKRKEYKMNLKGDIEEYNEEYYDVEYKELSKLDDKQKQRIKSIEQSSDGKIKIVLYDKQKALETLYNILCETVVYQGTDTGELKDLSVEELMKLAQQLEGDDDNEPE